MLVWKEGFCNGLYHAGQGRQVFQIIQRVLDLKLKTVGLGRQPSYFLVLAHKKVTKEEGPLPQSCELPCAARRNTGESAS
jgi:hypothetical protein